MTERTQNLARANQELRDQIAERKQAEAALRESELRFRQLAEKQQRGFLGLLTYWRRIVLRQSRL